MHQRKRAKCPMAEARGGILKLAEARGPVSWLFGSIGDNREGGPARGNCARRWFDSLLPGGVGLHARTQDAARWGRCGLTYVGTWWRLLRISSRPSHSGGCSSRGSFGFKIGDFGGFCLVSYRNSYVPSIIYYLQQACPKERAVKFERHSTMLCYFAAD